MFNIYEYVPNGRNTDTQQYCRRKKKSCEQFLFILMRNNKKIFYKTEWVSIRL